MRWVDTGLNTMLALLVAGSLALTGYLWFAPALGEVQPRRERALPPPAATDARPAAPELAELVDPVRILLHLDERVHTAVHPGSPLYRRSMWVMRPLLSTLQIPAFAALSPVGSHVVEQAWQEGPGIDLIFNVTLPLSQWGAHWQAEGIRADLELPVNRVFLHVGEAPALYLIGPTGMFRAPLPPERDRHKVRFLLWDQDPAGVAPYRALPRQLGSLRTAPGVFVPEQPPALAVLDTRVEGPSPAYLLPRLFADLSVVRQVEERDGAIIYTDGMRALRVYPAGGLEYTAPELGEPQPPPDYDAALQMAYEFVAQHGGWPEGLFLSEVTRESDRLRLTFDQREGRHLLVGPVPALVVEATRERVVYFYRALHSAVEVAAPPRRLISIEWTLSAVLGAVGGHSGRIADAYPVYWSAPGPGAQMRPVWLVLLENRPPVWVDGHTGQILVTGR